MLPTVLLVVLRVAWLAGRRHSVFSCPVLVELRQGLADLALVARF